MAIKDALAVINEMHAAGVISKYAIGGAVGALLYIDSGATEDVDVFIDLPIPPTTALVSLSPVYAYLLSRGCKTQAAHIMIADWPVQFLPVRTSLEREALELARLVEVDAVNTFVIAAEYLVAIALQTGRAKDHARILLFIEQHAVDRVKLENILQKHGLSAAWQTWMKRFE